MTRQTIYSLKKLWKTSLSVLGLLLLLSVVSLSNGCSTSSNDSIAIQGDKAVLRSSGSGKIWVAVDEKALDEYSEAALAKDNIGFQQLVTSGRLYSVDDGTTEALVLKTTFTRSKVRIMSGLHQGRVGWVPREWAVKR